MSISIKVHSIDKKSNSAIISVVDNNQIILSKTNCTIELNKDGSANTEYFKLFAKFKTFRNRLERLDRTEDDLL